MDNVSTSEPRWNLFARELQDILAVRNLRLGHLRYRTDEFGVPLVHHEKVARLKRSLLTPKSFTVLNPDELERVSAAFGFTAQECRHLYAALLATSIEVTLMDRIDPASALQAAEYIVPVLRQALDNPDQGAGLRAVRGGGGRSAMREDERRNSADLDARFEKALDAIDRGTLALHLAGSARRYQERIDYARQAQEKFQAALRLLETATGREREDESWQLWHTEAGYGRDKAADILAQFGISASGPA